MRSPSFSTVGGGVKYRRCARTAWAARGLAANVAFLFSDDGAYVTGQTIVVDGGANFT